MPRPTSSALSSDRLAAEQNARVGRERTLERSANRERAACELDPEANLVFRLARPEPIPVHDIALDAITDWQRVLQIAASENAVIALRDQLRAQRTRAVPLDAQRYLAMLALDRQFRMRLLQNRLEESVAALNTAGIEAMLLKGGALASTIYDSFTDRPMRDIDLLVQPDRADEARALMLDLGWAADPELPGDHSYATHHHLPPLRDTGPSGLRLEIHRALVARGHPFRFREEDIWKEARVAYVGKARSLVMHPAHHAVYIAIHFAWSHMLKSGAWHAFRDLAMLAAKNALDWENFLTVARSWGASSCCYWTIQLASVVSDLPVPTEILENLRPRWPGVLHASLQRHLTNGIVSSERVCPSVRLDQTLWELAMLPRRDGHGAIRPWSVSKDLSFARSATARSGADPIPNSAFRQLRRSARYLSHILVR
jgi:putative nucleotidyltransferase-like protein